MVRIGSLFSGAGGLDMAVEAVFGGEVIWHSEIDKAASKVLAYRFPAPNLGSITEIDWATVEPVDVLCGGFPCQDVSAAGKRAGIKDGTRSGLWAIFADAIDALRPRYVVVENVRGLLSATAHRAVESDDAVVGDGSDRPVLRALGAVLGDLSDLGYDAKWATVAAASVGAPHRRERVFIVAHDSNAASQRCGAARRDNGLRTEGLVSHDDAAVSGDEPGVALLPTPTAALPHDGWTVEQFDAWKAKVHAEGRGANGMRGDSLEIAAMRISGDEPGVALLPTPVSRDHKGRNQRDDDSCLPGALLPQSADKGWCEQCWVDYESPSCLCDEYGYVQAVSHLLPTPRTSDTNGAGHHGAGGMDLRTTVTLLPTPNAQDGNGGGRYSGKPGSGQQSTLPGEARLLCTPSASDGAGGKTSRSGGRIDEPLLGGQAREMESSWGKYEPAIRRWEQIVGPAPAPTEPNKNGNPRLSAAFSEWLMGWPAGWVTDPAIGISRNDQLRIVGNGVCTQQAIAALRYLLAVTA